MVRCYADELDEVAQSSISWADGHFAEYIGRRYSTVGRRAHQMDLDWILQAFELIEERDEHRRIARNPPTFMNSDHIPLCRSIVHVDTV